MVISEAITIIIYIFTIVFCSVVATLYVSRTIRKSEPISKTVSIMMTALLLYTILELLLWFFDETIVTMNVYIVIIVLSDLMFFTFVVSWLITTVFMTGNPYLINLKGLIIYTLVYAAVIEPIGIGNTPKTMVTLINLIFDGTILVISLVCLIYAFREMKEQDQKKWVIGFSIIQALYMVYIMWWDAMGTLYERGDISRYSDYFDPISIVYVLICIIFFALIWKRRDAVIGFSIADTIGITDNTEEKWDTISTKYKLTMREIEVSQLTCKGLSNPDIAGKLFISENTVKHHLNNIYRKTGVKSRFELINILGSDKN